MLYLTEEDVRRLLPMHDCIGLMESAFRRLAVGESLNHSRQRLVLPTRSVLHYMAAHDGAYFGIKVYSSHPRTGAFFLVALYRAEDARPLALIEANHLGRIRTGAASGYASRMLARPESRTLGILGSGFQARTQVEAIAAVFPLARVLVWSRSAEKRAMFAHQCSLELGIEVRAAATAEAAVEGADIVVTATNAGTPVLQSEWVRLGAHLNAVGSNHAQRKELPEDLVRRCELIVADSREQARTESGDLLAALDAQNWSAVRELHEVAAGHVRRTDPAQITLFKSNGMAIEDVVAAGYVYERAQETGAGRRFYS
jgi:ornithine cyclodeaminase/alanine dehydrogenase-like protein (mu-crystallin family)